ncbi:MAG: 30S ribosomal protein THX [Saprospiraceae bacterium]|nr:30S ribosomal protein THX [Saprospiraceae bacterium]
MNVSKIWIAKVRIFILLQAFYSLNTTFAAKLKQKFMGRGDKRTAKGKRTRASYGNSRPKKIKSAPSLKKA